MADQPDGKLVARPEDLGVHSITHDEIPDVVETLALAFMNDPSWSWIFNDEDQRLHQLRTLWHFLVMSSMRYPWTVATADLMAAALWIPPGGEELTQAENDELVPILTELMGERVSLALETFELFDEAHPHDRDHYYLDLLGTHPKCRGRGIGFALVVENLRRMDEEGAPAYLESSNPANLVRYQGLGFEPIGGFHLPDGGPFVTTMWREPRPPHEA